MEEQVKQLIEKFNEDLRALVPKDATVGARNPQQEAELRLYASALASNLMFFGIIRNNDAAKRWGMYVNGMIMDPVRWEELMTAVYGS